MYLRRIPKVVETIRLRNIASPQAAVYLLYPRTRTFNTTTKYAHGLPPRSSWNETSGYDPDKLQRARPLLTRNQIFKFLTHKYAICIYVIIIGGAAIFYTQHLETAPVSGRRRFMYYTDADAEGVYKYIYKRFMLSLRDSILPAWDTRTIIVNRVMKRLIESCELQHVNWEVNVVLSSDTDAILASALSHEIAHRLASHHAESMSNEFLVTWPLRIAFLLLFDLFSGGIVGNLLLEYGFTLPISRTQEREADYIGLMMMSRACYDPRAAVVFLKRLNQLEAARGKQDITWLSTHPSLIAMAHINIEDTPSSSKKPPRAEKKGVLRYPQAYGSRPSTHAYQRNLDRHDSRSIRALSHQNFQTQPPKTKIQVEIETLTPSKSSYSTLEKGKYREGTKIEPIMEESSHLDAENYQSDRLLWNLSSVPLDPGAESRKEIFRRKLAKAANAENFVLGENKKSGDSYVQDIHIKTWDIDPPTSARSSGALRHDTGTWRDFAYRDPWPKSPGANPILSSEGFGKFFPSPKSGSPESRLESPLTLQAFRAARETNYPQPLDGERRMGNEIFSDPRTANKVDRWLQDYSHPRGISRLNPRRFLLKQIFEDPDEVKLLRDILALVDFNRIYRKNELRHNSTKIFIKFYRKNAEIVLSRFRKQIKYKENFIPSLDELQSFKRWRKECAPWRAPYNSQDIMNLQSLQRDVNNLARSYYSIQVKEDPEIKFIDIYRAFYQFELYCQLFRISKFTTPETSGDRLEKMKRMFFERYLPYETSLIFKITRWILREWYTIDRFCDRNIKDKAQASSNKKEKDNANYQRYLGISFFAELFYSDTATQIALMNENRWQLKMIKFKWRTTCWAAQDQDEKGNVILIDDQELMEKSNDTEMRKRLFGSTFSPWTRLPM